jgi:hemerythrin-like metal-binding protein
MPLSRFIRDLDELLAVFNGGGQPNAQTFDKLRIAVTRMNEIRRQLTIADEKLGASLALAENELIHGSVDDPDVAGEAAGDRFVLHDCCRTRIDEIDDRHSALIGFGNRLYALSLDGGDADAMRYLIDDLAASAQETFAVEERLMTRGGYPQLEAHRAIHRRMLDYLAEMRELAKETPLLVAVRLEMFLGSWFVWHMQREDTAFAEYWRSQGFD